ncbi:T3SS effector HopA1 family protein [uncultured Roseibium sp.]|uniref:T3SS effector HopA1 family protein n=1 Tax=uncultured Roseibium sp. TaxID=1936171 RepID=UPI00260CA6D9|nr:T3SS effector HopA1 family protein [uncultured Roseibium sp.]
MALHRDLQTVVDWAWLRRADLMRKALATGQPKGLTHLDRGNRAVDEIYGYICGATARNQPSRRTMEKFSETLSRKLQNYLRDAEYICQTYDMNRMRSLNDFPEWSDWVGAFIHVMAPNNIVCRERVYLNLKEETRANAFSAILKKIWHLPGLYSAKVAAPGSRKTDTVVIYCDTRETREEVVRIVKKYQRRHMSYFDSQLPKLVASDGKGIGHGAEPPDMHPERPNSQTFAEGDTDGQSFGYYRATLIFIALERTQFPESMNQDFRRAGINLSKIQNANPRHGMRVDVDGEQRKQVNAVRNMAQKMDFERRVEEVFRLAGLSAEHPETQGAVIAS